MKKLWSPRKTMVTKGNTMVIKEKTTVTKEKLW